MILLGAFGLAGYFTWEAVIYVPPEANASTVLPGRYYPSDGNRHLALGERFRGYRSDPPTSGPHWNGRGTSIRLPSGHVVPLPAPWGVYKEELPPELLVGRMEQGGVVIWYSEAAGCASTCAGRLAALTQLYVARGKRVIMTPSPRLTQPVMVTAWTRLLALEGADTSAIAAFVSVHEGRYESGRDS